MLRRDIFNFDVMAGRTARSAARVVACVLISAGLGSLAGCEAVGYVATTAYRAGDHDVPAKYTGLKDKTFAVVVSADRAVQADYPDVMGIITTEVTRRLAETEHAVGASGMVAPADVLKFQYQHPSWVAMSPSEMAGKLGVDRLIFIDLQEYRLTDPGNPYLWNGNASATISVAEAENDLGAVTPFRDFVSVKFPDNESTSPQDIPGSTVQVALLKRFVERTAWLFYDHEEANIIKY